MKKVKYTHVDRYEPAIIYTSENRVDNFYLFDGDIKDCLHPFYIKYIDGKVSKVRYYSSERIMKELPIFISDHNLHYNYYNGRKIMECYSSGSYNIENGLGCFTELCGEM